MAASSRHPYVALLRAINVGGHGVVTMAELRARFEAFGCGDVATHIQSGNVLFTSKEADERRLERALEGKWKAAAGAATRILVRTPAELRRVAEENPFDPAA
ncbi:MAG TPA: DUF1697 domain-containing protein, partial [Minicystis sp.]|nr:DUF1697 domain-containing protein [Minicystis sp.]